MPVSFTRITPSIPVSSISSSIDFYTTKLGFRLAGRDRDDHCWLSLSSETQPQGRLEAPINIYLRRRGFPDVENDNGPGKVYIRCEGSEDEFKEFFAGLVVSTSPQIEHYDFSASVRANLSIGYSLRKLWRSRFC
jgi:catechol 2,3-dioxygenase-like lactoylglutathione lyase family enzyme